MNLPSRTEADGTFPFGRPNRPRDWTWEGKGNPSLLVVGVYPSAVHVRWSPPAALSGRRISALAVDVEPSVFWTGDDAGERVYRWREDVGFVEGDTVGTDGRLGTTTNGPSGLSVSRYLTALGHDRTDTAFLDVFPLFVVHMTAGSQGMAIRDHYNPLAPSLASREPSTLPARPTAARLPGLAVERFGGWLGGALHELRPERVVTLGDESWAALRLLGVESDDQATKLRDVPADRYGAPVRMNWEGRRFEGYRLAHPGVLTKSAEWTARHEAWIAVVGERTV